MATIIGVGTGVPFARTRGGGASLALDFLNDSAWVRGGGYMTVAEFFENYGSFTRAGSEPSAVTVRDSSGKLVTVAADTPRLDHDASGNPLGLLIEGQRSNRCTNYNAAPTDTTGLSVFSATVTIVPVSEAPSEVQAALAAEGLDEIVTALTRVQGDATQGVNVTGATGNTNTHTMSVRAFVAAGSGELRYDNNGSPTSLLSDFKRTISTGAPDAETQRLRVMCMAEASDVYLCLNQLEEGSNASSPIIVAGSAATRAAERDQITLDADSLKSAVVTFRTGKGAGVIWQYDDGTEDNRVRLERDSGDDIVLTVTTGGVEQASITLGSVADDTEATAAISWEDDAIRASLDGSAATADTSATVPTGLVTLRHGHDTTGNELFGHIARSTGFPTPKSQTELDSLSGA